MKTITVKYLDTWFGPPRRIKGRAVNAVFAVVKIDGTWNMVHRQTGVHTHYRHTPLQRTVVEMARAAAKKFRKELDYRDPHLLTEALRDAGSGTWAKSWWKKRMKAAA